MICQEGKINLWGGQRGGKRGRKEKKKETLAAMTARNPQKAAEAILADVTQGIDQIKSSIMGK